MPLCAGIGGVFNFLAGVIKRAPDWMQHFGFEWAFRLAQEPQRLWKRYLVNDMPILLELLMHQAVARVTRTPARPKLLPVVDAPSGDSDLDLA